MPQNKKKRCKATLDPEDNYQNDFFLDSAAMTLLRFGVCNSGTLSAQECKDDTH